MHRGEAPEVTRVLTTLRGARLESFLAELARANGATAAARCLTETFATSVGADAALLYVLGEGEAELRLAASAPAGFDDVPAATLSRTEARARPLFAAALSLTPIASVGDALGGGRWIALPLPQPQLEWSSAPVNPAIALRRVGAGWRPIVAAHGERRARAGLAPLGVALLRVSATHDAALVVDALHAAASLAGPILARGLAVEQYRATAERLDHQHQLLREVIDTLPDPVLLLSDDGSARVLAQNLRAERLFAGNAAAEANALAFRAAIAQSDGASLDLAITDPTDGSALAFEVGGSTVHAGSGVGRLVVLRDVTALRRASDAIAHQVERARDAEREATRERDRLDRILDYVADPIVVTNRDGVVVESNTQADGLLAAAENRDAILRVVTGIVDSPEGPHRARLTLVHPGTGNPLPAEVVAGAIADAAGESVVVSVVHDLTTHAENERLYEELKRFSAVLEARVRAATADLAEQNAQLQSQSVELERANRLKSEFLASMSHELRTPINALIGYTALLRDKVYGELTPKQDGGLRRIQTSAEHLLALINDILDLARIEAGRMPVHLERVVLAPLLREIAVPYEAAARAKRLEFSTESPAEPLVANTDPEKLRQVLGNLLSNAVKFTPHGRVSMRATQEGDRARIDISDSGIGIAAEHLDTIWEDFRQLDQSRTREYGGTGLGLSIVRKLAERLNADVSVTSEPDVGSTFTLRLPLAKR